MNKRKAPASPKSVFRSAAVRLVLFGMPKAGKTSLLGALVQAAETQPHLLNGRLSDLSDSLSDLRRRVYEDELESTTEEIVPYPIRFSPADENGETDSLLDAVLIDCNGQVANEILARRTPLNGEQEEGKLARAILDADVVCLVVDASSSPVELDSDFSLFDRFLELFERSRGRRTDVSRLPVFLVLTKCDLLAGRGESSGAWIQKIEERKSQVASRFKEHLSKHSMDHQAPFGSVEVHIWATAIKRPALADVGEKKKEPYGVAELFRQALASAVTYRQRRQQAGRKLMKAVGGLGATLGILAAFIVFMIWNYRDSIPSSLETRVEQYRREQQSQTPLAFYRTPKVRIDELSRFLSDPSFAELSSDKRSYVQEQMREMRAYQTYDLDLQIITDPRNVTGPSQLEEIEKDLKNLVIPPEFEVQWRQADAARRRADWLEDVGAIRTSALRIQEWYDRMIADGRRVLDDLSGANLPARAKEVLGRAPPFPEKAPEQFLPGSRRVSYNTVFRYGSVPDKQHEWEEIRKKLERYAQSGNN